MSTWYPFSNVTPLDSNSLQAWDYTTLVDDDKAVGEIAQGVVVPFRWDESSALTEDIPNVINPDGNAGNGRWIRIDWDTFNKFYNGTFEESFNALVTSDGATVTMALAKDGGGNLTCIFSSGHATHTAGSIALTAGSDISPTSNYIYILESDPTTLVKDVSDWPATEHIKVGFFVVPSAAYVQTYGCYINQNWNDHHESTNNQGHLSHIGEVIRLSMNGASYHAGVAGNGNNDYIQLTTNGGALDNVQFKSTAGICYQMHKHVIPAVDTTGADFMLVVNDSVTAYDDVQDLNGKLLDSTGASMSGKYFNLVFWGVANKTGEFSPLMVNLPSGSYTTETGAINDTNGYDTYTIPHAFREDSSTGFLICRVTFKHSVAASGTWTVQNTTDLRGAVPGSAAGIAGGGIVEFPDNVFKIFDEADITRELAFTLGGITSGNTRTITPADADMTLLSATQYTDLTDGGDTNLHMHDTLQDSGETGVLKVTSDDLGTFKFMYDEDVEFLHIVSSDDDAVFLNPDDSGKLLFKATDSGSTVRLLLTLDPNSGMIVYDHLGNEQVSVTSAGMQLGGANARITTILDEDDFASDSATAGVTQQSAKAYADGLTAATKKYEKQDGSDGATSNTVFTIAGFTYAVDTNTLVVYVNGQKAEKVTSATDETEYEETSTSSVTFGASLLDDDVVEFYIHGNYTITDTDNFVPRTEKANKNAIINGDFNIWQRGTSFAAAGTIYTADRFKHVPSNDGAVTVSRDTDIPTLAQSEHQSNYSFKVDVTTADAALGNAQYELLRYAVEGYDFAHLQGKNITLSFWVKCVKTGTYCIAFQSDGSTRSYVAEYTISAASTWEKKEITIALDEGTAAEWETDNAAGLLIWWCLGTGSDFQGVKDQWNSANDVGTANQVNFMDHVDNNFWLSQIQLEVEDEATPLEFRTIKEELDLCQRYFQKSYNLTVAPGTVTTVGAPTTYINGITSSAYTQIQFVDLKVSMRTTPTVTCYSPSAGTSGKVDVESGVVNATVTNAGSEGFAAYGTSTAATIRSIVFHWQAAAEL